MRVKPLLVLIVFYLFACNNEVKSEKNNLETEENKEKILFEEYLKKIPVREFPINLTCGLPDGPGSNNIHVDQFNKYEVYIPQNQDLIYGIIGQNKNFQAIIYAQSGDDLYPTLFTYDNHGKILDSLFLILNPCGGADEYQIPQSFIQIDKTLEITLIDTTKNLEHSNSISVNKVVYQIKNNGQIQLKKR